MLKPLSMHESLISIHDFFLVCDCVLLLKHITYFVKNIQMNFLPLLAQQTLHALLSHPHQNCESGPRWHTCVNYRVMFHHSVGLAEGYGQNVKSRVLNF